MGRSFPGRDVEAEGQHLQMHDGGVAGTKRDPSVLILPGWGSGVGSSSAEQWENISLVKSVWWMYVETTSR